jgi:hypothetical protein
VGHWGQLVTFELGPLPFISEVTINVAYPDVSCGGAVKWQGGQHYLRDYNHLPAGSFRREFFQCEGWPYLHSEVTGTFLRIVAFVILKFV